MPVVYASSNARTVSPYGWRAASGVSLTSAGPGCSDGASEVDDGTATGACARTGSRSWSNSRAIRPPATASDTTPITTGTSHRTAPSLSGPWLHHLVQPGHRRSVACVAERFQRLVPRGAEQLVDAVHQILACPAARDKVSQLVLPHHDVAVGAGAAAPQAQTGGIAKSLTVDALAGLFGDFEAQHRPRLERLGDGGRGTCRPAPVALRAQLARRGILRRPTQLRRSTERAGERPLDMRTDRSRRRVDINHAARVPTSAHS